MTDLDIAVVGGGIAGLACAHVLRSKGRVADVFETTDRPGGRMRSESIDGFVIDTGAETIAAAGYDLTWKLIGELGLRDSVVPVRTTIGVWRGGRVYPRVGSPLALITGAGLTIRGRFDLARLGLRALRGALDVEAIDRSSLATETVVEIANGLRPEVLEYLLQPAVSTAFGWDPAKSSAAPALGSLLATRGVWRWRTYRGGMDALALRLASACRVHTSRPVRLVTDQGSSVRLTFNDGSSLTARGAVLALPAPLAVAVHPDCAPAEKEYLDACSYSSIVRLSCMLNSPLDVPRRRTEPGVFAVLVPSRENDMLTGITIDHNKAPDRAPPGKGLVTLLASPRIVRELLPASDQQIRDVLMPVGDHYLPGIVANTFATRVHRFEHAQPDATPRSLALRSGFVRRESRRVEFAGDWVYMQLSSEGAVRSGYAAASRIVEAAP